MRNLVILGMHRSGTSMVAGALTATGLNPGPKQELLSVQEDNPYGFYERRDVVEFNDHILQRSGGAWFQPPKSILASPSDDLDVRTILSQLDDPDSFLLKDPRMVLTWPSWEGCLGNELLLFVYRNPLSVAESLKKRNGFPLLLGLALWEYYNLQALEIIEGSDSEAVSFDEIAASPEKALSELLEKLRNKGLELTGSLAEGLFDNSLGNSGKDAEEGTSKLLTLSQQQLARYCESLCIPGSSCVPFPGKDDSLVERINDLAQALSPLAKTRETAIAYEEAVALCRDRTSERDQVLDQLKRGEADHEALASAHEQEIERHHVLAGQHGELEKEHAGLSKAYTEQEKSFRQLEHKADFLYEALNTVYRNLLQYETSFLASIQKQTTRAYRLLTFRRGVRTTYEDALEAAGEHFKDQQISLPEKPPGKLALLGEVTSYVMQNPAGSARSFSYQRLRRALEVLFKSSPEDFGVWVRGRFPDQELDATRLAETQLGPELDELELSFPEVQSPLVSIVIPVYNEYRMTINCLRSILDKPGVSSYEIIIADDCSTDLSRSIEKRVKNITVERGRENLRFVGNCNRGAQRAQGKYLLFLNNDTAVAEGWLDSLVEVAEADDSVGIVGPKLLFADGKLQEAGGIMWRDASAWNYGRGDDPDKPEYQYLKPVDYISGACLLVKADLWEQCGGFDTRYAPAYYEDADLAFEARALGYQVIYQPAASVFHFEGVSNGSDLNSGVKQYQVDNQAVFLEKWQEVLKRDHFDNAQHVFLARDRSRFQRTVVYIDHYVPHYDKDAGSRSTFMYIQLMLDMGYRVLFVGANFFPHQPYTKVLQQLGVEVLVGEYIARNFDRWLRENAGYIDNIYIHRPHVAEQFLATLSGLKPQPKLIYFGHDLHYLRIQREFELTSDKALKATADKWRQRECAVFDAVDTVYYPSQVEVDEISKNQRELEARAIPLYALADVQVEPYQFEETADILFIGGFNHPPNVDAVCWFAEKILPLVADEIPGIRLHVVGSNPTDAVQALQSDRIQVYGYLTDEELDELYKGIRLVVVPLRFGAGVKGKVLEAIQKGRPLITTAVGAEGIPEAEKVMTIADSVQEFSQAVKVACEGNDEVLRKYENYEPWLRQHFSRDRAAAIITEDFGPPQKSV